MEISNFIFVSKKKSMRYVNLAFLENRVAKPGNYDVLKGVAKNFSILQWLWELRYGYDVLLETEENKMTL